MSSFVGKNRMSGTMEGPGPPTKRRRAAATPTTTALTRASTSRTASSSSESHPKRDLLLSVLPDELFIHVVHMLLRSSASRSGYSPASLCRSVVRLAQVCSTAGTRLVDLRAEIKRLRFDIILCQSVRWSSWQVQLLFYSGGADSWACCGLLPTRGRSCWRVRVDSTGSGAGLFYVGITDASARWAWGLCPARGHLRRWHRDTLRRVCGAPVPATYPNGHLTHVLYDPSGAKTNLHGRATVGCTIVVMYDADEGALAYSLGEGGPVLRALGGFPKGEAMRPWVRVGQEETLSIRPAVDLDAN